MNYYEELGLRPSASVAEIHQVYKSLARLLHPDYQSEEQLRRIAEIQMMRLNEILAVLTDPAEREKYDATIRPAASSSLTGLETPVWKRLHLGPFRIRIGAIAWSASLVLAGVALSFTLLYFERGSVAPVYEGNSPRRTSPSQPAVSVPAPIKGHAANPTRGKRPTKRIVRTDLEESSTVAPETMTAQTQDLPQASQPITSRAGDDINIQVQASTTGRPGPSALNRADSSRHPFVGTWLYAKSSLDAGTSSNLAYRPEYIEMVVISEQGGGISGRYLGRFQISDQALSSEVSFTFHGSVGEGTTVLPWHSVNGAEGRVRMKIVSGDEMEVAWYTTRFGTTRKLASGSAVLRRD